MQVQVPPPPPPPSQPRKRPIGWIIGIIAAFAIGVGVGTNASGSQTAASSPSVSNAIPNATPLPSSSPSTAPSPPPSPSPSPVISGKYERQSCDVELDTGPGYDGTLIGSVKVINTGTADLTAKIEFAWLMGDGSKVAAPARTVTVATGRSKLVFFKKVVTQDQVGNFQAHPGYQNSNNCKVTANIK